MGTYIGMGMAAQYAIPKRDLRENLVWNFVGDVSEEDLQKELRTILPESLYGMSEDEKCYYFLLNGTVSVEDVISIYDEFNNVVGYRKEESIYIKEHRDALMQMKTLGEVLKYASNRKIKFWKLCLVGYIYSECHLLFGKMVRIPMYVDGVDFYIGLSKTISESETESFDIFTDLLKYRLKGFKLADAMKVHLTE